MSHNELWILEVMNKNVGYYCLNKCYYNII